MKTGSSRFKKVDNLGYGYLAVLVVKNKNVASSTRERNRDARKEDNEQNDIPEYQELRETIDDGFVTLTPLLPNIPLEYAFWIKDGKEPRGVAVRFDITVIGFVNHLLVIETNTGEVKRKIENILFRNIHSVNFSKKNQDRVLVTCTGTESILEIDINTEKVCWEWCAWDNGFNTNPSELTLVRSGKEENIKTKIFLTYDELKEKVVKRQSCAGYAMSIDMNDITHLLGLEKWQKSVDPNWATYGHDDETILATFLHGGVAVKINKNNGQVIVLRKGLERPHGLITYRNGYVVSDTGNGAVLILNKNGRPYEKVNFSDLDSHNNNEDKEWIQNTHHLDCGLLATIDSKRNNIYIWDPTKKTYSVLPFPENYALQSVRSVYRPGSPTINWWEAANTSKKRSQV